MAQRFSDNIHDDPNASMDWVRFLAPATRWVPIIPNDGVDLPSPLPRAIYVGTGGNLFADSIDGDVNILFSNVGNGAMLAIRPKRIRATGTTAGNIVALY